jgi:NADPH-dependent glutamate synthase beta subunit-like oxidoreductase
MPLAAIESGASEELKQKRLKIRQRILDNAQSKFLFKFQERSLPSGFVIDDDHVKGVEFIRTEIVDGRPKPIAGTEFEATSPLIISSIGSVPDRIDGLDMRGEYYTFTDWDLGTIEGYDHVFGVGNVVTGQGNIAVSRQHGEHVANWVNENFLSKREALAPAQVDNILERARALGASKGYEGRYADWIRSVMPPDMQ